MFHCYAIIIQGGAETLTYHLLNQVIAFCDFLFKLDDE